MGVGHPNPGLTPWAKLYRPFGTEYTERVLSPNGAAGVSPGSEPWGWSAINNEFIECPPLRSGSGEIAPVEGLAGAIPARGVQAANGIDVGDRDRLSVAGHALGGEHLGIETGAA